MSYEIKSLKTEDWPPLLKEINDPPEKLYYAGQVPDYSRKLLCVVGSRRFTQYGKEATEYLIEGLKGYPVTIVSGLALGIDSIAHKAALKTGLPTISIPGSGLDPKALHPQSHVKLAEEIVANRGTLISELEPDEKASLFTHNTAERKVFYSFPRRNRIMAGSCQATLIIEADLKSGTLITARLTSEYNRELLALPGSIFSQSTLGPHMFIRLGAALVRSSNDILEALKIDASNSSSKNKNYADCSENELKIIALLREPMEKDEVFARAGLSAGELQTLLTLLELKGYIKEFLGQIRLN
jgi:DNA processing protein